MTTRRTFLILAGAAAGVAGCRSPRRTATMAVPDVLIAETAGGLVVLDGSRARDLGTRAATSPDGAFVYAAGENTLTGPTATTALEPGWAPQVVSPDGTACALRRADALMVARGSDRRRYDVPATVQPDAFTCDNTGLFVLQWLAPENPDRYRVRLMDLTTGVLHPLLTRTKAPVPPGAEEEMRGEGRQAVLSGDREILYTLYTHQPGHLHTRDLIAGRGGGGVHAFVHVLHLEQRWAYCLDLPHPFGEGPAESHSVAVDSASGRLAVVDVASGSLAYARTESLTIERVDPVPVAAGPAALALAGNRAYVGAGTTVTVLDGSTTTRLTAPSPIRGLGLDRDANLLYLGGTDEIRWLDAVSGKPRNRTPVPGLTRLRHVVVHPGT
ncbi:hypothetical protein [Couchioplanes caeruleus]|uniref:Lipoprotein n=2 Tax=Couchioplanes caeruleus TaxID=56438 RepID=A0A1K0FL51_9ACTN|nr:hypothetical protein [Couchioplanes caeruleus]OJF13573.1 hypothetical protein BG844_14450 [Couchioplanes caeruleus subsp. caeruleus]ROP30113.1 hypothetical protein EDD30_2947 [Couchioplanes caeruleus]